MYTIEIIDQQCFTKDRMQTHFQKELMELDGAPKNENNASLYKSGIKEGSRGDQQKHLSRPM